MKFSIKKEEKYSQITIHDDKMNSLISPELKSEIVKLTSEGIINIILNLSEVKYVDSSGLSSILFGDRTCKNENGIFMLAGCSEHVLKLLKISQLDTILNIIPTVEEAVDAVFMNELEKSFGEEAENEEQV